MTKFPLSFIVLCLTGCTSYYIPVDSFKTQFQGIDSAHLKLVKTAGPLFTTSAYMANPIENIKCVNKNGDPILLKNSPSLEIRFTEKDKKRTIFYFDRVYMRDKYIIGYRSRFLGLPKAIPIDSVELIEIQNGQKDFHYVDKNSENKELEGIQ